MRIITLLGVVFAFVAAADVDGQPPIKQNRRYLSVKNATQDKLVVYVQYDTWVNRKNDWQWFPREPEEGEAVAYALEPGQTMALEHEKWPVNARRVRIWARSESGEDFNEYRNRDLWLVELQKDGERYYMAPKGEIFTFTFTD